MEGKLRSGADHAHERVRRGFPGVSLSCHLQIASSNAAVINELHIFLLHSVLPLELTLIIAMQLVVQHCTLLLVMVRSRVFNY